MLESVYQTQLIKRILKRFPGSFVFKNGTDFLQGYPDLTFLLEDFWALLEVKAYEGAPEQPNQRYYIEKFNRMSFAAFIYPENEVEILDALQGQFEARRNAFFPEPQQPRMGQLRRRQAYPRL
jgi:hypothetical protein